MKKNSTWLNWNNIIFLVIGFLVAIGINRYEAKSLQARFAECYFDHYCRYSLNNRVAELTEYEWSTHATTSMEDSLYCSDFVYRDLGGESVGYGVDKEHYVTEDLKSNEIIVACLEGGSQKFNISDLLR